MQDAELFLPEKERYSSEIFKSPNNSNSKKSRFCRSFKKNAEKMLLTEKTVLEHNSTAAKQLQFEKEGANLDVMIKFYGMRFCKRWNLLRGLS